MAFHSDFSFWQRDSFSFSFSFRFFFFFLEYRLINWGRNHYKRYTRSQPLIPAPVLETRGSNTIGLSAGRAEQVDSIEIHTKNLMASNVCVR